LNFGVDGDDDTLRTEPFRAFGDQLGPKHRGGIDGDFVRACA